MLARQECFPERKTDLSVELLNGCKHLTATVLFAQAFNQDPVSRKAQGLLPQRDVLGAFPLLASATHCQKALNANEIYSCIKV